MPSNNKKTLEGHKARKNFGQNFLRDESIINSIVSAINPKDDETLVEIGPGLAALTEPICERIKKLNVIEIDRDLAERLRHHPFIGEQLVIHECDALSYDFSTFKESNKNLRVYGNLPYNISTPLLFHLFSFGSLIYDMHFMLQKEVVDRLIATPSTKDYGKLSIMAQYYCKMQAFLEVPPQAFTPSPKVFSAVIKIEPYKIKPFVAINENLLRKITTEAFNQRRKTIHNSLCNFLNSNDFSVLNIDEKCRAENLTVEQFVKISNYVAEKK